MSFYKKETSYPQPDAPTRTTSPAETAAPSPYYEKSFLAKYGYVTVGGFTGGSVIGMANYLSKKPILTGVHLYPIAVAIGATATYYFQKYKENQWAERDAIIRHYINLHPEDFPPYKQVKIASLFDDWTPVR